MAESRRMGQTGGAVVHHCHALGCKRSCPPRMLMCRPCWSMVPDALRAEVYRTVVLRGRHVDATWAPWWRAQARAIAHVAFLVEPNEAKRDAYLSHALAFADKLDGGEQSRRAQVTREHREAALLTVFSSLEAAGWLLREWVENGTMTNPPALAKAAAERSLPRLNKLAQLLADRDPYGTRAKESDRV